MPWTYIPMDSALGKKIEEERKKERKERSKHVKNAFYKESYNTVIPYQSLKKKTQLYSFGK